MGDQQRIPIVVCFLFEILFVNDFPRGSPNSIDLFHVLIRHRVASCSTNTKFPEKFSGPALC